MERLSRKEYKHLHGCMGKKQLQQHYSKETVHEAKDSQLEQLHLGNTQLNKEFLAMLNNSEF